MNIMIITDLEGVTGVTTIDQMNFDSEEYFEACRCITKEVEHIGKALKENGADNIYFLDGHGGRGTNIDTTKLSDYLIKVDIDTWCELLKDGKIDVQIETGVHARAGTIGGFLDHTFNSKEIFSYKINGRVESELSVHSLIAGVYNVPVILCIGDYVGVNQAKEYIPDIHTIAVKKAETRNECVCFENAYELIEEGIKKALSDYKHIKPMTLELPAKLEITYYRTDMCEKVMANCKCKVERIDARTLLKHIDKAETYWDLRIR